MTWLGVLAIEFHLNNRSGVAPYLQLIRQVRQALRLGLLRAGDQLPTVKDVAGSLAINPNTVLKAYRLLEYEGLVAAKPGVGTFVTKTVSDASVAAHQGLNAELSGWIGRARQAGLDLEDIEALFQRSIQSAAREEAV
jgi:GntR family transcriptional regulator